MSSKNLSIRLSIKDADTVKRALETIGSDGQKALQRIEKASQPTSMALKMVNATSIEVKNTFSSAAGAAGSFGSVLSSVGPSGLLLAAGIGTAVIGINKLVDASSKAISEMDALGDAAQALGLTTDELQELRYAAEQTGSSQEKLDAAMRKFTQGIGETAAGVGEVKTVYEQMGISVQDSEGKIKSSSDVLNEVADYMAKIESPADKARIAIKMFGESGVTMVNMLTDGSKGLDGFRKKAQELGVVIDASLIQKAGDAQDQLATMHSIIDANLNSALVEMAPILVNVAEGFAGVAKWVAEVVDGFREIDNQSTNHLKERLDEINSSLSSDDASSRFWLGDEVTDSQQADLQAEKAKIEKILANRESAKKDTKNNITSVDAIPEYNIHLQDTKDGIDGIGAAANESQNQWAEFCNYFDVSTDLMNSTVKGFSDKGKTYFKDFVKSGKVDTADLFSYVLDTALDVMYQLTMQKPLENAISSMLSSGVSSWFGSGSTTQYGTDQYGNSVPLPGLKPDQAHTGGVIGSDSLATHGTVSWASFANAPKFHTGGVIGANEVPIIAQQGEAVFTKGQLAALGGAINSGPIVNVNVTNRANNSEASVQQNVDDNGNISLDIIVENVEKKMANNVRRGEGLAPVFESKYGLNSGRGAYG